MTSRLTRDRWKRIRLVAIATLAVPVTMALVPTASKPEEVGLSSERLQRVHEAMQRHVDAKTVSGVVTLVARKGRVAHFEAQGLMDIESKKPMPKDGIFRLASMSKPITGAAVLMLVEEGKIRLNDPVSRFIPEFKNLNKVAVAKPGAGAGGRRPRRGAGGRRPRRAAAGVRSRLGVPRDHDQGPADARIRPDERRARQQRGAPACADRHAGDVHPEAGERAARLSAGHALALQRPGRLRRAQPRGRSGVGPDVRAVPEAAALRARWG